MTWKYATNFLSLYAITNEKTAKLVVPSPGVRVTVVESMICDLGRVSEWCDLRGMKLNESETMIMIVSRSHTVHPSHPH